MPNLILKKKFKYVDFGEYNGEGWIIQSDDEDESELIKEEFNPVSVDDGLGLAHDFFEHVNKHTKLGTLENEMVADCLSDQFARQRTNIYEDNWSLVFEGVSNYSVIELPKDLDPKLVTDFNEWYREGILKNIKRTKEYILDKHTAEDYYNNSGWDYEESPEEAERNFTQLVRDYLKNLYRAEFLAHLDSCTIYKYFNDANYDLQVLFRRGQEFFKNVLQDLCRPEKEEVKEGSELIITLDEDYIKIILRDINTELEDSPTIDGNGDENWTCRKLVASLNLFDGEVVTKKYGINAR